MDTLRSGYELPMQVSHFPFRMRFDPPLNDKDLQTFCERQEVLHVEREPNGELEVRMIGGRHAGFISARVGGALYQWSELAGAGECLHNVGFFLPDGSMRGPRYCWISKARFGEIPLSEHDGFIRACPEFVVEILSHNYTLAEMQQRMTTWMANGCELAWLIDPERKAVEIYRPGKEPEIQEGDTAAYGDGPVGGFVLELAKIWS